MKWTAHSPNALFGSFCLRRTQPQCWSLDTGHKHTFGEWCDRRTRRGPYLPAGAPRAGPFLTMRPATATMIALADRPLSPHHTYTSARRGCQPKLALCRALAQGNRKIALAFKGKQPLRTVPA